MGDFEKLCFDVYNHNFRLNENSKDIFACASAQRKTIAQVYHASLTLLSNEAACQLLEDKASSYFALVDQRGEKCINNYAEAAISLASSVEKSETSKWKSFLRTNRPTSAIVEKLHTCKNNCTRWKVTPEDLQILSKPSENGPLKKVMENAGAVSQRGGPYKSSQNGGSKFTRNTTPSEYPNGNGNTKEPFGRHGGLANTDRGGKSIFSTSCGGSEMGNRNQTTDAIRGRGGIHGGFGMGKGGFLGGETEFGNGRGSFDRASSGAFGRGGDANFSGGRGGFDRGGSAGFRRGVPLGGNAQYGVKREGLTRSNSGGFGEGCGGTGEDDYSGGRAAPQRGGGNPHFGGRGAPNNEGPRHLNLLNGPRGRGRGGANSGAHNQEEAGMSSSSANFFRTAKAELGIQNQKKYGSRGGGGNSYGQPSGGGGPVYGGLKRSLGPARRAGVHGKFVPPVRPTEEDDFGGMFGVKVEEGASEQVDERLKNIDPKMIELIRNEIMDIGAPVGWDDIAGLEFAKSTIQEIVVWPLLRPDIFTGLRKPPKGLLLFGPPGTGKTLIGKCIASQSQSTFFSISASSLTSKWIGDGEKMVRALFAVAKVHQPAVVFIDEIDSLLTQRSDTEHESSRRIKTEFLVQLDGAGTGEEERILVVGATNRPQELDEAARRRLVKRLYIPLPEFSARRQIVERLMSSERCNMTDGEIDEIATLTEGYSGADMKNLCQEASLGPIRSISFSAMHQITADQVRPVTVEDFKTALQRVRASVSNKDLDAYVEWDRTYGMGSGS